MPNYHNQAQNPVSEYLLKLQLIVTNSEFKDEALANKYETYEIHQEAQMYIRAMTERDLFESYEYNSYEVYDYLISVGLKEEKVLYMISHPELIPVKCKEYLKLKAREEFISKYVEKNKYYVNLMGKPFQGDINTPPDKVLLVPDEFYDIYADEGVFSRNEPIHELPDKFQELFMNTTWYKQMLKDYPELTYLRYIGTRSIDLVTSRTAQDGDIISMNTDKMTTYHPVFGSVSVSPDIIHKFVTVYKETRDYVYLTLRGNFSEIYPNYDSFIRFLTIYLSIGNALNEYMKNSSSYINMNNVTANNLFMLYGLPSVIMEGTSMIEFLKNFRLILMDKGTNIVYRVKDLIGYEYTDIYTLVMVKQQVFENGTPVYLYDDKGNRIPKQNIVFRRLGTTEDNTSYFKFRDEKKEYSVEEITSGDPRWWNTPEVEEMIQNMNYTLSNSKYIQLSTHLSLTDIWWQCVIFIRGLLDNKSETQLTYIDLNYSINGSSQISVFDAVLLLTVLMNWQIKDFNGNNLKGNMYVSNGNYNGKEVCLDLLFNGLNIGYKYQQDVHLFKDQIVSIPIKTPITDKDNKIIGYRYEPLNGEWYKVNENYVSDNTKEYAVESLRYDVENGNMIKLDYDFEDGSPIEPKFGLPFKISSFNFNIRRDEPLFYESIKDMDYIEPETFLPMLESVLDRESINIGEVLMKDVRIIYDYLANKLRQSMTIQQFRQVTDIFNKLFLVDPIINWSGDISDFDVRETLMEEYNLTIVDYAGLQKIFTKIEPDFRITFKNEVFPIYLYDVMNYNVTTIRINDIYPFTDETFVSYFSSSLNEYISESITNSTLSRNIKDNYKDIIMDKIHYETSEQNGSPTTFEFLLLRTNAPLYRYINNIRNNNDSEKIIMLLRSLIKALESYAESPLSALEFKALGIQNYFYILKEVISYFKSYMVEYSKEEFTYLFDGIFDNGGNSNMLKLFDEFASGYTRAIPKDSLTLYDVSCGDINVSMKDDNTELMYDDAIFRIKAKYSKLLNSGYEIWYDDGKRISKNPISIDDDTEIVANLITDTSSSPAEAYKIIININNLDVVPPNYYGNSR